MLVRLLLSTHDESIKLLFHAPGAPSSSASAAASAEKDDDDDDDDDDGDEDDDLYAIAPAACFVFFLFSYCLGLLTYGLSVPSGLFVPSIMAGGAVGRLVGEAVTASGLVSAATSPGNYALIGAAGMLGGICRMTISITVIIVECTGHMTLSLIHI